MAKPRKATAIERTDRKVAGAMLERRRSAPVRLLDHVADLGDQPQLRTLCGAVIAAGLAGGDRRLAMTGVKMLAAHTLATFAKDFVKRRIDRTRPRSRRRKGADDAIAPGRSKAKEETSFPSGHSAGAAAVARAFARAYPDHALPAYAAGGTIALAQIPRCAHYPTDVGAGLVIGIAAEALTEAALSLVARALPLDGGGLGGGAFRDPPLSVPNHTPPQPLPIEGRGDSVDAPLALPGASD